MKLKTLALAAGLSVPLIMTGSASAPVAAYYTACPWDCQDVPNGTVDIVDMFKLFGHWFAPGPCDFDGNGLGDINDLFAMFGSWGGCP